MAAYFSEEQIEEIRRASDIVEVIREYLPLKRAGKDFKALCPFHTEKTPSFQVSPTKQIFKCFGCGRGGNVFTFVMAVERMEFPEAVEHLARRAGIELKAPTVEAGQGRRKREKLFEINHWAAKVFHRCLMNAEEEGRPGREYLTRRGLSEETWTDFRLGYSPDAWDFLLRLCGGREIDQGDLADAGLALPRQGGTGYYDRFRDRVIFPIFDVRDRVVGFGGRTLGDSTPKYLNSPETSIFNKSDCLYGLNAAKDGVLRRKQAAVVEGYTDCLMAHQVGVDWVVATLGTALTPQHVGTLRRYVDEVVLVFDGDNAGRAAAERSVDLFLEQDVDVRVALLPGGVDPCEFIEQRGKDAFVEQVDAAIGVFDLKMRLIGEHHDLSKINGRMSAIEEVLDTLAKAGNTLKLDMLVSQNEVLKELCRRMGVTETSLRQRLRAKLKPSRAQAVTEAARPMSRTLAAQRELLGTVLSDGELSSDFAEKVDPAFFNDESTDRIAAAALKAIARGRTVEPSALCDALGDETLTQLVVDLAHESERKGHERERFDAALRILRDEARKARMAEIMRAVAEAGASGDEEKVAELTKQYNELLR